MFPKASCRPLLLSALVCLLTWVAICVASPMDVSSLTPKSEPALGIPYENTEKSAYIQNLPHYNQLPIINQRIESQELIDLARRQYGAVYLYHIPVHRNEPFSPSIYRSGQRATSVQHGEAAQLQSKLTAAPTEGRKFGNAVRWLKHGRPFSRTDTSPYSWKQVWDGSQVLRAPSSQNSVDWFAIRNILQGQRRVVLTDPATSKTIAFRLDALGQVESDVKDMVRALHRRSYTSSNDVPSSHILKTKPDGAEELFKRGLPFNAGSSAPQPQTLEFVLSYRQGFNIQRDLARTSGGVAGLDSKWARILHFRGHPVLDVHTTSVGDLEQAVVDYDYIYVYGTKQGQSEPSIVRLFRSRAPVDPDPNSSLLRQVIEQSRIYEGRLGQLSRALVDGRPIQRIAGAPAEEHVFLSGHGHPPLDLHAMRAALATSGSFRVENVDTGDTFHWRLNDRNLGSVVTELAHDVNLQHPFIKRMSQSVSPDTDHHYEPLNEVAPASLQLVKRMNANQHERKNQPVSVEMLLRHELRYRAPREPLTEEGRKRLFATDIHYDRVPILSLDPNPDQLMAAKLDHAIDHYQNTWLTWKPSGNPTTQAARFFQDGRVHAAGMHDVLRRLGDANDFGARYGDNAKYLRFGLPFSRRHGKSSKLGLSRKYKPPAWKKVSDSPVEFDLAFADPVAMHNHLDENNFLKAKDPRTGAKYGFALNREGDVLFEILSEGTHHLGKRAPPHYEASELEFYAHSGFVPDETLPVLTPVEKGKYYADVLHYKGEPILFPQEDRTLPRRAQQALRDYQGFWAAGTLRGNTVPTAIHYRQNQQMDQNGVDNVLSHIRNANLFEQREGKVAQLLEYGPGFPRRKRSGIRFWYKTPSWKKVRTKAERVGHQTPIDAIWEKLHEKNMIVVTEGETQTGFSLNEAGRVLRKVL